MVDAFSVELTVKVFANPECVVSVLNESELIEPIDANRLVVDIVEALIDEVTVTTTVLCSITVMVLTVTVLNEAFDANKPCNKISTYSTVRSKGL